MDKEILIHQPPKARGTIIHLVKGCAIIDGYPVHWNVAAYNTKENANIFLDKLLKIKRLHPATAADLESKQRLKALKLLDKGVRIGQHGDPVYYVEPLIMDRIG